MEVNNRCFRVRFTHCLLTLELNNVLITARIYARFLELKVLKRARIFEFLRSKVSNRPENLIRIAIKVRSLRNAVNLMKILDQYNLVCY